jgi:hypothetical protein
MTTNEHRVDAIYALGRSEVERRRLIEQDASLGGFTRRHLNNTARSLASLVLLAYLATAAYGAALVRG